MKNASPDPIPQPVRDLMALFADRLEGVRFPNLDATVLQSFADAVHAKHEEVEKVRGQLEAAQQALEESRAALVAKAQQALAYAQVYALDQPALFDRLQSISLGKAGKLPKVSKPRAKASAKPTKRRKSGAETPAATPGA